MASQPHGGKDHLRCDLNKGILRKKSLMAEVILSMTRVDAGSSHGYVLPSFRE